MGDGIEVGQVFTSQKTQQMARDLLAAAEELGVDVVEVRATVNGFVAPKAVWDAAQRIRAEREGWAF